MRDKEVPYGYQMKDGMLIENPAESSVIQYIFQKTSSYTKQPPIWGEMAVEDDKIYLGDELQCTAYQFAICYLTKELNIASELLSQCGGPQMELAQILEDEGYKAAIRGRIVDEGVAALLMSREPNWQGVMVADVYEEMVAHKTAESNENQTAEKRDIITPEEFAAAQAILMK